MSFYNLLASLNKVSALAFLVILILLIYELYLLSKEKRKKSVPKMPEFHENNQVAKDYIPQVINQTQAQLIKKSNNALIMVLVIFLIVFAVTTLIGYSMDAKNNATKSPAINLVYSKGIDIFDTNWRQLSIDDLKNLKSGYKIILAIDKVNNFDIDMARIKVNEQEWRLEHTTLNFNKDYNVFYKEYFIASNEAELNINAQLHSRSQGWLGK